MEASDPNTLLEWLQSGRGLERDIQQTALENLCMLLLMSDNIDRCFENYPPRSFLPALCRIFLDETAPDVILEVTARAITYYLDVSHECTRRVTHVEGTIKAICNRLTAAEMTVRTSKDLAEQCVKLLEHICQRETSAVYDAGGLPTMLNLIKNHGQQVHKDTVHSAMSAISRLCGKLEPNDEILADCCASLGVLLEHEDTKVSECALRCFSTLTDRFVRKSLDPAGMAEHANLVEHLLNMLLPQNFASSSSASIVLQFNVNLKHVTSTASMNSVDSTASNQVALGQKSTSAITLVISLLNNLCKASPAVTRQILSSSHLVAGIKAVLFSKDEHSVVDALRFCEMLIILLCEGRNVLQKRLNHSLLSTKKETGSLRVSRETLDALRIKEPGKFIEDVDHQQFVKILLRFGADRTVLDHVGLQGGIGTTLAEQSAYIEELRRVRDSLIAISKGSSQRDQDEGKNDKQEIDEKFEKELVESLLEQFLTVFCEVFNRTVGQNLRRSVLILMRKAIHYMSTDFLNSLVSINRRKDNEFETNIMNGQLLAESIVNAIVNVLGNEDDIESQESALKLIKTLLVKDASFWLDQFIRVGIFEKVEAIAIQPISQSSGGVVRTMRLDEQGNLMSSSSVKVADSKLVKVDEDPDRKIYYISRKHSQKEDNKSDLASDIASGKADNSKNSKIEQSRRPVFLSIPTDIGEITIEDEHDAAVHDAYNVDEDEIDDADNDDEEEDEEDEDDVDADADGNDEEENLYCNIPTRLIEAKMKQKSISHEKSVDGISDSKKIPTTSNDEKLSADSFEIKEGESYKWKDWRLIKSPDSLFIWCDAVALELNDGSNGWFRFLLDGRLNTMYSSGSPEAGSDNAETRGDFVDKLNKARNNVRPGALLNSIFTNCSYKNIKVGKWILNCSRVGEIIITNQDGSPQRLLLMEDLPGFVFESNRSTQHFFQAESTLGLDFVTGWAARGGNRRMKFRNEMQKNRCQELAREIWENYMKEAKAKPRDILVKLQKACEQLKQFCDRSFDVEELNVKRQDLTSCLEFIHTCITDNRLFSTFEYSISGLIDAFLVLFSYIRKNPSSEINLIFKKIFANSTSINCLARKMISLLEINENFPQYLYDEPGGSPSGFQLLNRKIRFKMQKLNKSSIGRANLIDRTDRSLKVEPLVKLGELKCHLLKMISQQWFDKPRSSYNFVKQAKSDQLVFSYASDFDEEGIIYWLGTNGYTFPEWTNPATVNVVIITASDNKLPYGQLEDILSRDSNALNCHSSDDKNAHFTIDLGILVYPNYYTLRHARGYGRSSLRNWFLQASVDGKVFETLVEHQNDTSLTDPGSTASWPIDCTNKGPYRYVRIQQAGKNASNQTCYLSVSGFEIYGTVVGIIVEDFPTGDKVISSEVTKDADDKKKKYSHLAGGAGNNRLASESRKAEGLGSSGTSSSRLLHISRSRAARLNVRSLWPSEEVCFKGERVARGPDWSWSYQGRMTDGTIVSDADNGWVDVLWDDETSNSYRVGAEGKWDLIPIALKDQSTLASKEYRGKKSYLPPSSRDTRSPLLSNPSYQGALLRMTKVDGSTTTPIPQKSMSTTNLSDRSRVSKYSVASTNQAASAESLQHQTPSLENLLARSRVYGDRIPEVVSDDTHSFSELSNATSETNSKVDFGRSAEAIKHIDAPRDDPSALSDVYCPETETTESANVQPSSSVQGSPLNIVGVSSMSIDEANAKNLASLSNSAPNLAGHNVQQLSVFPDKTELQKSLKLSKKNILSEPASVDTNVLFDEEIGRKMKDEDQNGSKLGNKKNGKSRESDAGLSEMSATNENMAMKSDYRFKQDFGYVASYSGLLEEIECESTDNTVKEEEREVIKEDEFDDLLTAIGAHPNVHEKLDALSNHRMIREALMLQLLDPERNINAIDIEEIENEVLLDENAQNDTNEDDREDFADIFPVEAFSQAAAALRKHANSDGFAFHKQWKKLIDDVMGRLKKVKSIHQSPSGFTRTWDDNFILKQQFQALIPAFDPRPGRTNINQIQDVELPPIILQREKKNFQHFEADLNSEFKGNDMCLLISGPNLPNITNVVVELKGSNDLSIFYFLHHLVQNVRWAQKNEKSRRLWEPTYTLIYGERTSGNITETVVTELSDLSSFPQPIECVLSIISDLRKIIEELEDVEVTENMFISEKLTQKLVQELSDALIISSRCLPSWCNKMIYEYLYLFSFQTRVDYLHATAFGPSRSIVWLQNKRDQALESSRSATNATSLSNMAGARKDDHYPEYRIGRIKHERIKVPRDSDDLLSYAGRILKFHASRKSMLELEYIGEEGTGLGPTLEFYALVAAEFQRKDLAMWICDDYEKDIEESVVSGVGAKELGYYVQRSGGLFPAAIPQSTEESRKVCESFHVLGIFVAKVLQDGRLVDLPLSIPFLKLLVSQLDDNKLANLNEILSLDDLEIVDSLKGSTLKYLRDFVVRRNAIIRDNSLNKVEKDRKLEKLKIIFGDTECFVEDLNLTFIINPSSKVFQYDEVDLIDGGSSVDVTRENLDMYIEKSVNFLLNDGISKQMAAFCQGFNSVFPLSSLGLFTPEELLLLLCGDQCPSWTREELLSYTEPKLGFTKESSGFLRFVDVLLGMNSAQRKSFLQFTTGCSSLPPGGLANLHPRLTIVRKVDCGDGGYPSVNTCVHYLKLPDYSTTEIMRERILTAMVEKGFHLN